LEHLKPILKEIEPFDLELRFQPFKLPTSSVGISAGAAYGSAKRWKAEKFAEVVNRLPADFEVYIFGSNSEVEIANKVASAISGRVVRNLAGKTTIEELVRYIAGMNLFITNDSGPMHIAAAYKVPTVSIFGPTNWRKTSQWKNPNSITIHADLQCAPCMKRVCPLKTDECMKMITADEVLKRIEEKGWIEELF
jgi:heptosyltransferase-2